MSWLCTSGGQSIGASASVLSMNIQDSQSLLQHHISKASILEHLAFFMVQFLHPYMTTRKTIALTIQTFVSKVMSLFFLIHYLGLSVFLPRSKHLNFMAAITIFSDFGAQENKVYHNFQCSAIRVVSSAYLRLLIFLPAILIPACASSIPTFHMMYSAYKLNKQGYNI